MAGIKRALISVSDKTGVIEMAKGLEALGAEILSTGGTAKAAIKLVEGLGATVSGLLFLIELPALGGRAALAGHSVSSVIVY